MSKHNASYVEIAEALRTQIQTGRLQPGAKLQSESELGKRYEVGRQTIRRALDLLHQEHLIEKRQGSGSFVPADYIAPASQMESYTAKVINVITPFMDSYIFPNQISGMESVFAQHNYTVRIGVTYNKLDNEARLLKSILNLHPDGVIAEATASALPPINGKLYQALCDAGIPVVFVNAFLSNLPIPYVALDNQKGGYIATNYLIEMGHRQIGFIGKMDTNPGHLRFAGYEEALCDAGIPLDERRIVWIPSSDIDDWLSPMFSDYLLKKLKDCTAVFCYNDQIACTLIEILRQHDIRIPDDISIVGFDDSDYSRQSAPPCTTVIHPSFQLGFTAAGRLLKIVETGESFSKYLFEPILVKRETVIRRNV